MSANPNIQDLETALKAPEPNIYIAPDLAHIIITFLNRTNLQGSESEAMTAAINTLKALVK